MRIHTDELTKHDLLSALPAGVALECTAHGSRSRHHAFNAYLYGYAERHTRASGSDPSQRAATYSDWGRWIARLYECDAYLIAGPYTSDADFHRQTHGLYAPPLGVGESVPMLVDAIARDVALDVAKHGSKTDAYAAVGSRYGVPWWHVKAACFGEL